MAVAMTFFFALYFSIPELTIPFETQTSLYHLY